MSEKLSTGESVWKRKNMDEDEDENKSQKKKTKSISYGEFSFLSGQEMIFCTIVS